MAQTEVYRQVILKKERVRRRFLILSTTVGRASSQSEDARPAHRLRLPIRSIREEFLQQLTQPSSRSGWQFGEFDAHTLALDRAPDHSLPQDRTGWNIALHLKYLARRCRVVRVDKKSADTER